MDKKYISTVATRKAKPRSKRLREVGAVGAVGSVVSQEVDLSRYLPKATFDELFEKVAIRTGDEDDTQYAVRVKMGLYADGFVSALGSSSGGGSGSGEGSGGGMDESALADWMQQHISEYLPDHSGLASEQWVGANYVEASLYNQNVQATNQAISDINEAFSAINGNFSSIQSGFNQLVTDMSGLLPKSGGALDAAVVSGGSMAGGFLGFKDASEQANGTEDTKAKMLLHPDIGLVMHKDEDSWVAVTDDGFIPYNEAGGEPTMDLGRNGNRWRELHVKDIICNGVRVERKDYGFIRTAITEVDGRKRYRIHFGNDDHYIEYEEGRGFHFSHGLYSEGFVTAYGNDNGEGSAIDIPQVVDNGDGTITISVGGWSVTVWDTTADIPIENVDGLDERLTEDEGRIDEVEDEQQTQGQSIATLQQQIGEHAQRFVDLGQRVDGAESGLGRVGADLMTKADQSDVDDLGSSLDELRTVVGGHTTNIAGLRVDLGTAQDEINAAKAALGTKANSSDLDAKADKSGLTLYKAVSVSGKNALRVVTDVPKSYAGSVRIHIMGTADGEQIDTTVVAVRTPSGANAAAKWAGSTLSNTGYDISKVTLTTAAEGGTDYIAFVVKKADGYGNAKMLLVNVQTDEADGNTGTHVLKTYYDAAETTDKRELASRRHVWASELPTRVSDLLNDTIPIVKVEGGVLKIDDAEQGLSWSKITNRPTTVSGYGIADLSISSSGKITIGNSSITPITSHQSLSGYATQSWVTGKGYLTSHQAITVDDGMIKVGGVDLIKPYAGTYVPTADEVGARPNTWMPTAAEVGARPNTWTPTASDVGARPSSWMPTATEVGVPAWAQATSKPTYTASEVGARPSSWMPTASDVGARPSSWTPTAADVGVTLSNGKITIGNSSITPITSHQSLSGYATESWVTGKGYLTSHQAITVDNGMIKVGGVDLIKPYAGTYVPTAAQVGARPSDWTPTAAEVGARPSSWMPTAAQVGARPSSWMPTAAQVGARPSSWMPTAADVGVSLSNGTITINGTSIKPLTSHQSLAGYAKTSDLSSYATQDWVTGKGYLTSHQSLAGYAKTSDLSSYALKSVHDDLAADVALIKAGAGLSKPSGSTGYTNTTFVKKTGDTMSGTLTISTPTTQTSNYNDGLRVNLGGSANWAGVVLGGASGSTAGTGDGVWGLFVHAKNFYVGQNGADNATYGLSWTNGGALNLKTSALTNNGNVLLHSGNYGSYVTKSYVEGLNAGLFDFAYDNNTRIEDWVKATAATRKAGHFFSTDGWAWARNSNLKLSDTISVDLMRYSAISVRNGNLTGTWNQQAILFVPTYLDTSNIYLAQMNVGGTAGEVATVVKRYADYNTIMADVGNAYLPLSGGTLTGSLSVGGNVGIGTTSPACRLDVTAASGLNTAIRVKSAGSGDAWIRYDGTSEVHGYLGFNGENSPAMVKTDGSTVQPLLHSGNWSTYCAAASHTHSYLPLSGGTLSGRVTIQASGSGALLTLNNTDNEPYIYLQRNGTYKAAFTHHHTYGASLYSAVGKYLGITDAGVPNFHGSTLLYAGNYDSYVTKSYVDGLGVSAATADKLVTSRTIWGQSFDGSANVSGNMTGVGSINMTGGLTISTPTTQTSNYNEGLRVNLGGSSNWAAVVLGGASGSTAGTGDGVWGLFVNAKNFYIGQNGSNNATYGLSWTNGGALDLKTSALTNNGNALLHSGNWSTYCAAASHTHSYLPLSGGTLTGSLSVGGNVGIGTTSPSYKLDVNGSMRASGTLSVCPNTGSYVEGIRIHAATSGWTTLMLCGAENTADTGTSANSWSMHAYQGNFYLNKNGSNGHTGNELCNVDGNWGIGTNSPSYKLHVAGTLYASGAATFNSTLSTTGKATLASMGVTGAATVGGALGVTGNLTVSGTTTLRNVMVGRFADTANNVTRVDSTVTATGGFLCDKAAGTYINGCKEGCLTLSYAGYGSAVSMPTKNGRISIATYPGSDNTLYFCYGTATNIVNNNNTVNKISWNGSSNLLTVTNLSASSISASTQVTADAYIAAGTYITAGTYIKATDFICVDQSGKGDNVGDGWGLSLYNNTTSGCPTWGVFMGKTATYGEHGGVTTGGAYAMYFTINGTHLNSSHRGWVFQNRAYPNGTSTKVQNVFSISGLGNMRVSGTAYVVGTAYIGGATTMDSNLQVNGRIDCDDEIWSTTGVKSSGYVTALSDERLKEGFADACPDTADVAALPAVEFTWKKDGRRDMGSIAQAMVSVLPLCVHKDKDGWLSIDYGKAATMCAISVARKSTEHEGRIAALERQINELQHELETLKAQ